MPPSARKRTRSAPSATLCFATPISISRLVLTPRGYVTCTPFHARRPSRLQCAPLQRRVCVATVADTSQVERWEAPATREPCVLVGADITSRTLRSRQRLFNLSESLVELERLAETAGLEVVGTLTQTLSTPNASTYIGSGKVRELKQTVESCGCCTVVFDVELTPAQQRTLEDAMGGEAAGIKVVDRTALILDIFAQHARSREGKLQVELALYEYRLPRLTRLWTHLERQSGMGGVGLRGPGETQLEVDRRLIGVRVGRLKRELGLVRKHRERQREARRKNVGLPVVALIGYTNAGKSTLLKALTGGEGDVRDALFATLDPMTRRGKLGGVKFEPEVLFTDTVGFVQNLPTELVMAFRATLEEVVEADLLVHVVDGGVGEQVREWQIEAVEGVLKEIGGAGKRCIMVLNKVDLMEDWEGVVEEIGSKWGKVCVGVSAKMGIGVDEVGVVVDEELRAGLWEVEVVVPYDRGDLVEEVYRRGCVEGEEFGADGTYVWGKVPRDLLERLRPFFVAEHEQVAGKVSDEELWLDLAKKRHVPRG